MATRRRARGKRSGPVADQHKGIQVKFYANPKDVARWQSAADQDDRTLSAWLRRAANDAVSRS